MSRVYPLFFIILLLFPFITAQDATKIGIIKGDTFRYDKVVDTLDRKTTPISRLFPHTYATHPYLYVYLSMILGSDAFEVTIDSEVKNGSYQLTYRNETDELTISSSMTAMLPFPTAIYTDWNYWSNTSHVTAFSRLEVRYTSDVYEITISNEPKSFVVKFVVTPIDDEIILEYDKKTGMMNKYSTSIADGQLSVIKVETTAIAEERINLSGILLFLTPVFLTLVASPVRKRRNCILW